MSFHGVNLTIPADLEELRYGRESLKSSKVKTFILILLLLVSVNRGSGGAREGL